MFLVLNRWEQIGKAGAIAERDRIENRQRRQRIRRVLMRGQRQGDIVVVRVIAV
jgi:hypothetical protein